MPNNRKKEIETWVITKARELGAPIPLGEQPSESPDFQIPLLSGTLGVEVCEILRPTTSSGSSPVETENVHVELMRIAEQAYRATNAPPVRVQVYFPSDGRRRDKRTMARTLVECVVEHLPQDSDFIRLTRRDVPEGFSQVLIWRSEESRWTNVESGTIGASEIDDQLARMIAAKNELLPTYRLNLPLGSHVWLLLWSAATVARGVPIPYGLEQRRIRCDFDRVFFFSYLDMKIVEIMSS
jgi:hypothetical protein